MTFSPISIAMNTLPAAVPFAAPVSHPRRVFLSRGLVGAAAVAAPVFGHTQTGPVRLVVSYPAGGGADLMARLIAPHFSAALGSTVEVENMPGDSGQKAALHVAKAAPNGRTLLLDASSFSVNPSLFAQLPYDSDAAFSVLGVLAVFPNVLVCHPAFEAKTVADLIRMAKAKPDQIAFASSGNGSAQHLAGALFEDLTQIYLKHLPYKGGGPAMADVAAGKVPLFFANVASSREQLQSGKLRALAVTSRRRTKVLPQVPSMAEAGVANYEVQEWNPVLAPAGLPKEERQRLFDALNKALKVPEVVSKVQALGGEVFPNTTDGLAAGFIKTQQVQWRRVIAARKIQAG
ncbi:tripartite tricarboxylate transporter substrate binding protein [Acidovorax sp. 106]|uniref:tripartite tricarboxylate transporter substrate binding protein n=1 Tax=Acidovorax sp. 106 TaxID=2135637 RepID=UPI000F1E5582|nr:tripartite tricarboxylate transporter substrate binding protein [Acidovorax sp. 106]RLJ38362.1 tripartite-type tricarboxylate transporter receptor subunit TctC [Acidovorax sp. 106]